MRSWSTSWLCLGRGHYNEVVLLINEVMKYIIKAYFSDGSRISEEGFWFYKMFSWKLVEEQKNGYN